MQVSNFTKISNILPGVFPSNKRIWRIIIHFLYSFVIYSFLTPYAQNAITKLFEFLDIWINSLPQPNDLPPYTSLTLHFAISASLEKANWRAEGPQSTMVQRMVDFYWNVGSPDSEIDRFNDVGAFLQPVNIGLSPPPLLLYIAVPMVTLSCWRG